MYFIFNLVSFLIVKFGLFELIFDFLKTKIEYHSNYTINRILYIIEILEFFHFIFKKFNFLYLMIFIDQ